MRQLPASRASPTALFTGAAMRVALTAAVVLGLAFAALVGVIRAQPSDVSPLAGLSDFIMPLDGCRVACVFGIRPGITSFEAAQARLRGHPWVESFFVSAYSPYEVKWRWSGKQPAFIDSSAFGSVYVNSMSIVSAIRVQTAIPYGDFWLAFGAPDGGAVVVRKLDLMHVTRYDTYAGAIVIDHAACPAGEPDFWTTPVMLHFGAPFVPFDREYGVWGPRRRWCR